MESKQVSGRTTLFVIRFIGRQTCLPYFVIIVAIEVTVRKDLLPFVVAVAKINFVRKGLLKLECSTIRRVLLILAVRSLKKSISFKSNQSAPFYHLLVSMQKAFAKVGTFINVD